MIWTLPTYVTIDGEKYAIRNKCDFRVVLDIISALNDKELDRDNRIRCALLIFYEDLSGCTDFETAAKEMMKIINSGQEECQESNKPPIMDWEHDYMQITPPISRVLGYSVRDPERYTHWWDFLGAYKEIGECFFSNIISIRSKKQKNKKLETWEQEFYNENKHLVDLPQTLTDEEKEWLNSDW